MTPPGSAKKLNSLPISGRRRKVACWSDYEIPLRLSDSKVAAHCRKILPLSKKTTEEKQVEKDVKFSYITVIEGPTSPRLVKRLISGERLKSQRVPKSYTRQSGWYFRCNLAGLWWSFPQNQTPVKFCLVSSISTYLMVAMYFLLVKSFHLILF